MSNAEAPKFTPIAATLSPEQHEIIDIATNKHVNDLVSVLRTAGALDGIFPSLGNSPNADEIAHAQGFKAGESTQAVLIAGKDPHGTERAQWAVFDGEDSGTTIVEPTKYGLPNPTEELARRRTSEAEKARQADIHNRKQNVSYALQTTSELSRVQARDPDATQSVTSTLIGGLDASIKSFLEKGNSEGVPLAFMFAAAIKDPNMMSSQIEKIYKIVNGNMTPADRQQVDAAFKTIRNKTYNGRNDGAMQTIARIIDQSIHGRSDLSELGVATLQAVSYGITAHLYNHDRGAALHQSLNEFIVKK